MELVQAMTVIALVAFMVGICTAMLLRLAMAPRRVVEVVVNLVFWVVLVAGYLVYRSDPALFMAVVFEAN